VTVIDPFLHYAESTTVAVRPQKVKTCSTSRPRRAERNRPTRHSSHPRLTVPTAQTGDHALRQTPDNYPVTTALQFAIIIAFTTMIMLVITWTRR
jgi:hypothetical protein